MTSRDQFLSRLGRYCRKRGLLYEFDAGRGKGSHGRVRVGEHSTIVKSGEMSPLLYEAIAQTAWPAERRFGGLMLLALQYPVSLEAADGIVIARFRDLPEAVTEGGDIVTALSNAVDCLDAALHFRMKDGQPVPFPKPERSGERGITPTAETSMRVALYQAYKASGLSSSEFCQRSGMTTARFQEIVSTYRPFDMRKVADALRRLGRPVVLAVDAA